MTTLASKIRAIPPAVKRSWDASPEVEGNKITGSLSCATSNSPAITDGGQKNTVTGTKSGQCAGSAF